MASFHNPVSDTAEWQRDNTPYNPNIAYPQPNPIPPHIVRHATLDNPLPLGGPLVHPHLLQQQPPQDTVNHFDRVPDQARSLRDYTIFNEGQRVQPPTGPVATPISGRPNHRRPLSRAFRQSPYPAPNPQPRFPANPLRVMRRADEQSTLIQLARRVIDESREQRYLGGNPQPERRTNAWRFYLPQAMGRPDRNTSHRLATYTSFRRANPFGNLPRGPVPRGFEAPPLFVPPNGPHYNPATHGTGTDAEGNVRPILRASVPRIKRSPPRSNSPRPSGSAPWQPAFPAPTRVLGKREFHEVDPAPEGVAAPETIAQEQQMQPVAGPTGATRQGDPDEIEMTEAPALELEEVRDVDMVDLWIPGAWPASTTHTVTAIRRTGNGMQPLIDAATTVVRKIRNAHAVLMRLRRATNSARQNGKQVVRDTIKLAGTFKRRAVELCSFRRTPASFIEPIDIARDSRNLRVLTPEERHRQRARELRRSVGSQRTQSPVPYIETAALPPVVEGPPSPTVAHYPGSGQGPTLARQNKTNRPPERHRSSPVYNTDDLSPSRARKQRSPDTSPPSARKLQASQEFIDSTAIASSPPVQYDVATASIVEPSSSATTAQFDVFNPWSQQHYADVVPEPEPEVEEHPDQGTEDELFSAPAQQSAAVLGAPELDAAEEALIYQRPSSSGTDQAVKKTKKAAVRWADTVSPHRPISQIREYQPSSRIDSPLHTKGERLVRGGSVGGETSRPPAPPRRVFVKALPPKWEKKVDEAIRLPDSHQLATTLGGDPLTRRDLATCYKPSAWLNDEVINAYLAVIIDYLRKASGATSSEQPRYHAFNSFFFSNLRDKGYGSVRRWASRAKIGKENLLKVETVLVPVHNQAHWTLLVVRPAARTIEYFDSLGGMSGRFVSLIKDWLRMELGDRYVDEEWTVLPSRSAQQNNGSDCGVFLLTTAKLRALNLDPLSYGAKDIPLIRKRIVGELMNGGFGGDLDPVEGRSKL
ncbi:hypothetical protein FQN54_009937 [Arachnomyces sp. PD_36]|nr:hypothetical protein FQN54_009937 [Arachnomyces sp. PD_36]